MGTKWHVCFDSLPIDQEYIRPGELLAWLKNRRPQTTLSYLNQSLSRNGVERGEDGSYKTEDLRALAGLAKPVIGTYQRKRQEVFLQLSQAPSEIWRFLEIYNWLVGKGIFCEGSSDSNKRYLRRLLEPVPHTKLGSDTIYDMEKIRAFALSRTSAE